MGGGCALPTTSYVGLEPRLHRPSPYPRSFVGWGRCRPPPALHSSPPTTPATAPTPLPRALCRFRGSPRVGALAQSGAADFGTRLSGAVCANTCDARVRAAGGTIGKAASPDGLPAGPLRAWPGGMRGGRHAWSAACVERGMRGAKPAPYRAAGMLAPANPGWTTQTGEAFSQPLTTPAIIAYSDTDTTRGAYTWRGTRGYPSHAS